MFKQVIFIFIVQVKSSPVYPVIVFSMPILIMALEMLPNIIRRWLQLGVIGLVSLLSMGLSVLKPGKKSKGNIKDHNQTATNF
ncbi:hypothetical protein M3221_11320 [Domibacillus indicus]|uniref:hypothetical protein n=1 Tax=Domibacillus indicus TaxID=1437523 RepID=UPI00203EF629|nr:hypothetical protein [Domibacillus indicus]MCM3788997.1 hypothetical protein [Domibacillus indicus]